MKKNIIILAGVLLMASCENSKYDLENIVPEKYHKILYINQSGEQDLTLYDIGEDYNYTLSVVKTGSDPSQSADVTIDVMTQEQVDNIYNIPQAVNYKVLTEDSYSMDENNLLFSSTDHFKFVNISINPDIVKKLISDNPGVRWVLPLKATSLTDSINSEKDKLLLRIMDVVMPAMNFKVPTDALDVFQIGTGFTLSKDIEVFLDTDNQWELECNLGIDNDFINLYNEENSTIFQPFPEGCYSFSESVNLPVGTNSTELSVKVDGTKFVSPGDYMLPIRIMQVSKFSIGSVAMYPLMIRVVGNELDRTGWSAKANSEELTGETSNSSGPADRILDGNLGTYWHSIWQSGNGSWAPPYEIEIDAKREYLFTQVGLVQRGGGMTDTGSGEFYVSTDGNNWDWVGSFVMEQNSENQIFSVKPIKGQFIKIKILTSYRHPYCSLSEVYVYGMNN